MKGSLGRVRPRPASASLRGRRVPSVPTLLAISVCILLAALLVGVAAPPAQANLPGGISGTVTAADSGAGIQDVYVALVQWDGSEWVDVPGAMTDADGIYEADFLSPGLYKVQFRADDYIWQYYDNQPTFDLADDVTVTSGDTTSGIDAELDAACHITGTVMNASGVGLRNIEVAAFERNDFGDWDRVGDASTGIDGHYDLGGLAAGCYRIMFRDNSGDYVSEYYNNAPTIDLGDNVFVRAGAPTTGVDAMLALASHITGVVRGAGPGAGGLDGIHVNALRYTGDGDWAWEWVNGVQTAADGSYDLGGLPAGRYRIQFSDDSGNYVTQYFNNAPTIDEANDVAVAAGAWRYGINARLAPAGHVTGTVTDASAAGLGDITVQVYRDAGFGEWEMVGDGAQTDVDGTYDIGGLPAGSYRIGFWDQSNVYVEQFYNNKPNMQAGDDVVVTGGATRSGINARLALAGRITGRVTKEFSSWRADVFVTAYRYTGSGDWPWEQVSGTQTDADGTYDLGGLLAGRYRIEFYDASGYFVTQYFNNQPTIDLGEDVAVTAGGTRSGINARLALAGHVSGTVTDARGHGIGDISVIALIPDGSGDWLGVNGVQTAADGTYDLGGLPTDSYRILFLDNFGVYAEQFYDNEPTPELADPVAVTAGWVTSGIDATLALAGPVGATAQGASLAGVDLGNIMRSVK